MKKGPKFIRFFSPVIEALTGSLSGLSPIDYDTTNAA